MIEFVCWVFVVSRCAAFLLSMAVKWGWLEYLQVHAPNDFLHELLSCKFCCSWWMNVVLCLILLLITGEWFFLAIPICATLSTRELW